MNFFKGTYGFDILSLFLLIIGSLFNLNRHTRYLTPVLLVYVIFRTFSKNTYTRSKELNTFTNLINKILNKFGKRMPYTKNLSLDPFFGSMEYKVNQKLHYKIVKCPNCKQKLRLPRGKKKIIVTCKKCSHEFKLRT
ncbi:MAG: hypothetical protein GX275_06305 [Clostridiales bacterium]|nr:hypothetical protein [Clostridiales bacterium]